MKKIHGIITAASMLTAAVQCASGAVAGGDILVVDFGKTGQETDGNWNNVAFAANAQFSDEQVLVSNMVCYADGAAAGVSLVWDEENGSDSIAGIGGAGVASAGDDAGFTDVGTVPDNAQIDACYFNGDSGLVLKGLNSSFTYDLEIMSKLDSDRNALSMVVNGVTNSVEPDAAPYITAFSGISLDTNNEIVISFPDSGSGADLQHINALWLYADDGTGPSVIEIGNGSWTAASDKANFTDAVINDGTVTLTASANGQVSAGNDTTEWDVRQGVGADNLDTAGSASDAFAAGTYIDFTIDSASNSSDLFTLDEVSVSFWRNGAQAPDYFQLAYSDDASWTTADLLGSALNAADTDPQTITSTNIAMSGTAAVASFRLYYWDSDATRNESADFHLTDVSAVYTVDSVSSAEIGFVSIEPLSAGEVVISWESTDGVVYGIQSSLDLTSADGGWGTITNSLPATPPMNTYTDAVEYASEFYRIIIE